MPFTAPNSPLLNFVTLKLKTFFMAEVYMSFGTMSPSPVAVAYHCPASWSVSMSSLYSLWVSYRKYSAVPKLLDAALLRPREQVGILARRLVLLNPLGDFLRSSRRGQIQSAVVSAFSLDYPLIVSLVGKPSLLIKPSIGMVFTQMLQRLLY